MKPTTHTHTHTHTRSRRGIWMLFQYAVGRQTNPQRGRGAGTLPQSINNTPWPLPWPHRHIHKHTRNTEHMDALITDMCRSEAVFQIFKKWLILFIWPVTDIKPNILSTARRSKQEKEKDHPIQHVTSS